MSHLEFSGKIFLYFSTDVHMRTWTQYFEHTTRHPLNVYVQICINVLNSTDIYCSSLHTTLVTLSQYWSDLDMIHEYHKRLIICSRTYQWKIHVTNTNKLNRCLKSYISYIDRSGSICRILFRCIIEWNYESNLQE